MQISQTGAFENSAIPRLETPRSIEVEQRLGLRFVGPSRDAIIDFRRELEQLSGFQAEEGRDFIIPQVGFLETPLSVVQRDLVNNALGRTYARNQVELQNRGFSIKIAESGERMSNLRGLIQAANLRAEFSTTPFGAGCEDWTGKERIFWLREKVALKTLEVVRALNRIGLLPFFEDGFRPYGVQEGYFRERLRLVREEHPDWDEVLIREEACSKIARNPRLAAHKAGAAIDYTLRTVDGFSLNLGNVWPEGGALVALNCPYVTFEQWRTRQLFKFSAESAGLVVYEGEDWHASFGDYLAAMIGGQAQTLYGPIYDFDRRTGEITPYAENDYEEPFA